MDCPENITSNMNLFIIIILICQIDYPFYVSFQWGLCHVLGEVESFDAFPVGSV